MFLHIFKYELLSSLRVKDLIIWLMIFPIALGTFFKIAFGNVYARNTEFSAIPAAVVGAENDPAFRNVCDSVSEGDEALLKVTYTDEKTALEMLERGDVEGIFYAGDEVMLTVAGSGLGQTILKSFADRYSVSAAIIKDALMNDPASAPAVIAAISEDVSSCREIPLTEGNTDNMVQYFYNLIAMVAMYGAVTGLHVSAGNQANMSPLGARRSCAPARKSVSIAASFLGSCIIQGLCMVLCVSFVAFALGVDFGSRLPLVYAAALLGGCMGVSIGFFVGALNMPESAKTGVVMSFSMLMCFFSGLMVGNMKALISAKAPWLNMINPAAVVSDSIYCLNIYSDYRRFIVKMISMVIITLVFVALGLILTRRKKYASL
ncbi:MAG: ABC transporter permease [Ruminococcus sp.]|nr:ABC transporter permease [Ruminococcus sp.]